jgi:HSP20 family protein
MVRRTSPLGEILSLRNAMDRMFDESLWRPTWIARGLDEYSVPLDIQTTPDTFVVKAALPGVSPDDVEITIDGNTLTISAKLDEEREADDQGYLVREIRRGSFSRSVSLSSDLDTEHASADFENGVVTLTIPKAEQAKPRRIPIGSVSGKALSGGPRTVSGGASGSASGETKAGPDATAR